MRHWFKDQHFRSLLKNSSYLGVSKIVAALCGITTLALAGRGLGVILFGSLILISRYAKAVNGLTMFQSWQLIIRYGGRALHGEVDDFKTSTGFAFGLDLVGGFTGMVVGIALLPFIAQWVGIARGQVWFAMLYCTLLPIMGTATPTGVLRALDRFDLISWSDTVMPISRVILVIIAFAAGVPFAAYVGVWYLTELGANIFLWLITLRELRRRELLSALRPTLRPQTLQGAWRFAIHVNVTSSIQAAWGPIARLVVGGLLGPAGAALFRVASVLSDSAAKPADLLSKAFYPEVVRMDLTTKKPWKLMLRGTALAGGLALIAILILLFGGKGLLALLFGKQFVGAYSALVILMIVPFLGVLSFPLLPMLYALDRPDGPLKARIAGTLLFFLLIAPLSWSLGIAGAAIAFVIGSSTTVSVMVWQLYHEHRRLRPRRTKGAPREA